MPVRRRRNADDGCGRLRRARSGSGSGRSRRAAPARCRGCASRTYSPTATGAMTSSRALQDQRRHRHRGEVGAVVGQERDPGEPPGDLRVGAAEARRQLLAELRPLGVAHDHRRHRARPAEVVAVQRLEQLVDVRLAEPADVVRRRRCSGATGRPSPAWRSAPAPRRRRATPIMARDRVARRRSRRRGRAPRRSRATSSA